MSQSASGLQYDELGFLIGLKKTGRDVAKIDKNVEQIINLLEQALKARESQQYQNELPQPKLSALTQALIDAQREPVNSEDIIREQRQATTAINQLLENVISVQHYKCSGHKTFTRVWSEKFALLIQCAMKQHLLTESEIERMQIDGEKPKMKPVKAKGFKLFG